MNKLNAFKKPAQRGKKFTAGLAGKGEYSLVNLQNLAACTVSAMDIPKYSKVAVYSGEPHTHTHTLSSSLTHIPPFLLSQGKVVHKKEEKSEVHYAAIVRVCECMRVHACPYLHTKIM